MHIAEQIAQDFHLNGFAVAPGLFSPMEADAICEHYMAVHANSGFIGETCVAEGGVQLENSDPLRRYPRLMQMHRVDPVAMDFMLSPRIAEIFGAMFDELPLGVQTMFYFKPAGARGQALHQDQRYLRVEPGTCVAAWMALDDIDDENGCLQVVAGSQNLPVMCPRKSDILVSFTDEEVDVPEGMPVKSVLMKKGDVLFFNGQLIHGSGPNVSNDRFRRIIVGHYIVAEAERVSRFYNPIYRFDGEIVTRSDSDIDGGGPCGVMVDQNGERLIEMSGRVDLAMSRH